MRPTIHLAQELFDRMSHHALRTCPEECCGILIGHRDGTQTLVDRVVDAKNIAEGDRRRRYQVDWRALLATVRTTREGADEIVGFYHSHPDGTSRPSNADREAAWLDFLYVIVPIREGRCHKPTGWRVRGDGCPFERERVQVA